MQAFFRVAYLRWLNFGTIYDILYKTVLSRPYLVLFFSISYIVHVNDLWNEFLTCHLLAFVSSTPKIRTVILKHAKAISQMKLPYLVLLPIHLSGVKNLLFVLLVKQLYLLKMVYEKNQVIHHEIGFCEMFVTPSGSTCPVKDNFDLL